MEDAAAGRHPLHVAGAEAAAIAEAVAVFDRAGQHVGDRLDAAMRMPREPGEIFVRMVVAEVVEQQKRIEFRVSPNPNARRSLTPAPSRVGFDWTTCLTGRMDTGCSFSAESLEYMTPNTPVESRIALELNVV